MIRSKLDRYFAPNKFLFTFDLFINILILPNANLLIGQFVIKLTLGTFYGFTMIDLLLVMLYFPIKFYLEKIWTFFNIKTANFETLTTIIPSIVLTILSIPLVLILMSVFWMYRTIVKVILTLSLGNEYVSMITGCSLMSCLRNGSEPPCVTLLIIVKSESDGDKFYSVVKNRIHEAMQDPQYEPLFCLRDKFMDYLYLKKTNLQPEEVVKMVDVKNEEELVKFANKYKMSRLPRNNTGNFDLAVGNRILEDKGGYPLVVRVHHCLTDGLSFYNIIRKLLCKPNAANDMYANDLSKKVQKNTGGRPKKNILKEKVTTIVPSTFPNDIFKDVSVKSEIITSFMMESEEKYVPIVKRIKNRIPGMSFNAILLGAFSASIAEYYINNMPPDEIPEYLNVGMPVQIKKDRFEKAYSSERAQNFENDFSICYYNLPIIPKSKRDLPLNDYLIDKLIFLREEFQRIARSPEIMMNYALMKILVGVVPSTIVDFIYSFGGVTTSASCLPGGPKLYMFQGDEIHDLIFFTPKQTNMSICFCALTYDNRLQMSLKTSKKKIPDTATLDSIMNGVLRTLDVMDEKTKLLYVN